jgi:hypothetical protein
MASTYSALKIELIGTGEQSGTWGATTNVNLGDAALGEAITGSADVAFSSADVTVTLTDTNATQAARNLRLNLTGTSGGARQLILGSGCQIEKLYLVNNGLADAVTVKNTSGTGIAVPAGKSMFVFNNGTNVVDAVTHLSSLTLGAALPVTSGGTGSTSTTFVNAATNVTGTLPVGNGGTGAATIAANNVILGNGTSAVQVVAPSTAGNVLTSNGTTWTSAASSSFSGATINAVGSSAITLTNTSTQYQVTQINSVANSIVNLPSATTLSAKGFAPYVIENRNPIGTTLSIKDNAGTVVGYIPVGYIGLVGLADNSTSAGSWDVTQVQPQTFFNWDTASYSGNTQTGIEYVGMVGLTSTTFVRFRQTVIDTTVTVYQQACTISGSTITFGATVSFTPFSTDKGGGLNAVFQAIRLSDTAYVLKCGATGQNSSDQSVNSNNFRTCTVSGTTITTGSPSNGGLQTGVSGSGSDADGKARNGIITRLSDTTFALVYNTSVGSASLTPYNYSGSLACQIVSVSGTTQTVGTAVNLGTSTYTQPTSIVGLSSTSLFVAYGQAASAGGNTGRTKMNVVSVSGTVPTWGTSVTIESADTPLFLDSFARVNSAVAPSATQVIFNTGYNVSEASISGTTPTYNSSPSPSVISPLYLSTSTKAYGINGQYLNIQTGGFVLTTNGINLIQVPTSSSQVPSSTVQIQSPLGAQPTTAYVGVIDVNEFDIFSGSNLAGGFYAMLGNTL